MRSHWIFAGLLGLLLLAPAIGWTYVYLLKSAPAHGAVLSRAPARVQLWFRERLGTQFFRLSVWNHEGKQVDIGDVRVGPDDPKQLSVGVPTLAPGAYTVKSLILSEDGYVVESQFSFTVRSERSEP